MHIQSVMTTTSKIPAIGRKQLPQTGILVHFYFLLSAAKKWSINLEDLKNVDYQVGTWGECKV